MEDKNRARLEEAGNRVREKIASSTAQKQNAYMGMADDFANDTFRGNESMRRNDGSVRYSSALDDERGPKKRMTKTNRRRKKRKKNYAAIADRKSVV